MSRFMATKLAGLGCLALMLAALMAAPAPAWAKGSMMGGEPEVSAKLVPSREAFARGGVYPLAVAIKVAPGFHINGTSPDSGLIPTKLALAATAGVSLSAAKLPPAHRVKLAFSPKPVEVYDGEVLALLTMTVSPDAPLGPAKITGSVSFQACNNQVCLMPQSVELDLALELVEQGKEGASLNQEIFKK